MSRRDLTVAPERLADWLAGVDERHGPALVDASAETVALRCPDGTCVELDVPYPPLDVDRDDRYGGLVAHALTSRTVGLLLLRRGSAAVGVAAGGRLVAAKVERRRVQGRTAAGGWSQQRFARRREQQANELVGVVAEAARRVMVPYADRLDAMALGGDRLLLRTLRDDARLAPLWRPAQLSVPVVRDPRHDVLVEAAGSVRRVRVTVVDPPG